MQAQTLTNLIRNPELALRNQTKPLGSAQNSVRTSHPRRTVGSDSMRNRNANQWSPRMLVSLDARVDKKLQGAISKHKRLGSISNIDPSKNMT